MQFNTVDFTIEFYRTYTLLALDKELNTVTQLTDVNEKIDEQDTVEDWKIKLYTCDGEIQKIFLQVVILTIQELEKTREVQKNSLLSKLEGVEKCAIKDSQMLRQVALRVITDPQIANKLTSPKHNKK